jgi:predicted Zn-dependent peptidase
MLQNPLLDSDELEREKGVIVEEINMYKDMPMAQIGNLLENTMWPGTPLGRDIGGDKSTVMKFTREMFVNYLQKHYQTPNMILGVSGKFNPKHVDFLVNKHWKNYPRKSYHSWTRVKDTQKSLRVKVQYKETEQAHLAMGFKGFAFEDKRNVAATLLSAVLGGGMSSRLFTEVREKRGLAYYVRTDSSSYQDNGSFNIGAGVQVGKIEEALQVIIEELKRVKSFPVNPKELNKAKEYIKGRSTLALEDNQTKLDWYLEQDAFYKKILKPQEYFDKIDKITSEEVQAVAKHLFNTDTLTLAVIGPYKSDKHFKKLLKI